jgi:hypothetical protein
MEKKHSEKLSKYVLKWKKENPFSSTMIKKSISHMKSYLSGVLTLRDIPSELVELKRLQIKLHRAIKQREQQLKNVL